MYSLNAPVPASVSRLARGLAADTIEATPRDRHTFVIKRLGEGSLREFTPTVRETLRGVEPIPVRIDGVGMFREPTAGRGPVVYLDVESPELMAVHRGLCEPFEPVDGFEGDEYTPHVTIARGGDADRLLDREVTESWTIESLFVWNARYNEPVERIALPA